jgi:hypothetical protein
MGWVCELNVAEAASSAVLAHSNSNLVHSAGSAEEVTNSLLFSVETDVSAEHSCCSASLA